LVDSESGWRPSLGVRRGNCTARCSGTPARGGGRTCRTDRGARRVCSGVVSEAAVLERAGDGDPECADALSPDSDLHTAQDASDGLTCSQSGIAFSKSYRLGASDIRIGSARFVLPRSETVRSSVLFSRCLSLCPGEKIHRASNQAGGLLKGFCRTPWLEKCAVCGPIDAGLRAYRCGPRVDSSASVGAKL
jgi:hypothetical protein